MKNEDVAVSPSLESLYAFRTITMMLGRLQSSMYFTEIEWRAGQEDLTKHLKVLDALAAMIIRDYGVAAVMANPVDGSEMIKVLFVSILMTENSAQA